MLHNQNLLFSSGVITRSQKRRFSELEIKDNTPAKKMRVSDDPTPNKMHNSEPIEGFLSNNYPALLTRIEKMRDDNHYFLPSLAPKVAKQIGYCCGEYALQGALAYAYPDRIIPLPRADEDEAALVSIAKKSNLSSFGEIFRTESLKEIAKKAGFPECKVLPFPKDQKNYIQQIVSSIECGGSVVAACDLGKKDFYPGNNNGLRTHWLLIFGYFYSKGHCYFAVVQSSGYYVMSAERLYQSNLQLPRVNPRGYPHYVYFKWKDNEYFLPAADVEYIETKKLFVSCQTLTHFAFGALFVPKSAPVEEDKKNINLTR